MARPEYPEIIRESFDVCFRHFWDRLRSKVPKGSEKAAEAKVPIAEFCGVNPQTVARWMYDKDIVPPGEIGLKMMCYLDMLGYRVIELERMSTKHRNFAELIGFSVIQSDEAAALVGYNRAAALFRALDGESSREKDGKMWEVWKSRKEELARKKEDSREKYNLDKFLSAPTTTTPPPTITIEPAKPIKKPQNHNHPAVLQIVGALHELLPDNLINHLSDEELVLYQDSATMMLQLSARLSALGSQLITAKAQQKEVADGNK